MEMTPLRLAAINLVFMAGYPIHNRFSGCEFKLSENKAASKAGNSAYDVYVKMPGWKRGKCLGSVMLKAVYP